MQLEFDNCSHRQGFLHLEEHSAEGDIAGETGFRILECVDLNGDRGTEWRSSRLAEVLIALSRGAHAYSIVAEEGLLVE